MHDYIMMLEQQAFIGANLTMYLISYTHTTSTHSTTLLLVLVKWDHMEEWLQFGD